MTAKYISLLGWCNYNRKYGRQFAYLSRHFITLNTKTALRQFLKYFQKRVVAFLNEGTLFCVGQNKMTALRFA